MDPRTYSGLGGIAYGHMALYYSKSLTESIPPQKFVEPLTLDEVKTFCHIPVRSPIDNGEDKELLGMIAAARETAEIYQNQDLIRKQYDAHADYFFTYAMKLRAPLISVDLLQYKDNTGALTTLTENVDYVVDTAKKPGLIMPAYNRTWPTFGAWPSSAVLCRYTAGYSLDSAWWANYGYRVKIGMKMLISMWVNNKIPFELGTGVVDEYPFTVTDCLSYGGIGRAN